jgi:predicted nicotinamide N-methyase
VGRLMLPFLERCAAAGMDVLIGDPDRRDLPVERLERLASYAVGDVGDARTSAERVGSVYRLRA